MSPAGAFSTNLPASSVEREPGKLANVIFRLLCDGACVDNDQIMDN